MGRTKKPDLPPKGAPMWIVTFTDMSSLMLTFFILMLTFSSIEEDKQQQATGSLAGAFGAITDPRKPSQRDIERPHQIERQVRDKNGAIKTSMRKDVVDQTIMQLQDPSRFNVEIKAQDLIEGRRIEIVPENGDEFFGLGSDRLEPWAARVLNEIGLMFRTLPCRLVVEVHIDDLTWKTRRDQTARGLTMEQGLSAAEAIEAAGFPPERVSVSPFGDARPKGTNERADDRYRNRRMVILVIPHQLDELYSPQRKT